MLAHPFGDMLHGCWPFPGQPNLSALAARFGPPGPGRPPFFGDPRNFIPNLPVDWRMAAAAAQEQWALHQAAMAAAAAAGHPLPPPPNLPAIMPPGAMGPNGHGVGSNGQGGDATRSTENGSSRPE